MAKKTQLVSQFLENISCKVLEEYFNLIRQYTRGRQGVYALYRRDKLYYVGLALSLSSRLKQHLKDGHKGKWDRFSVYLTIGDTSMKEMESLLLRIVDPPGNKVKGRFNKSENLKRKLKADIKAQHNDKMNDMIGHTSKQKKKAVKKTPKFNKTADRKPIMAGYFDKPTKLRRKFKGRTYNATVRRDGAILRLGKIYSSPSVAAREAINKQACNGWAFWEYERAPGDWVKIDELRKRKTKKK